jgi:hypothetical protein
VATLLDGKPTILRLLVLSGVLSSGIRVCADDQAAPPPPPSPVDAGQKPLMSREVANALTCPLPVSDDAASAGRASRFRPFRMMPGFLTELPGLNTDDDPAADAAAARDTDGPSWIQVNMGSDNPYFDFRVPGDPGGVGFYKVHSQVQLLDSGSTCLCFNCLAVTPAGLEAGGVADARPTVITPGLGVFQELAWGTALQGYVGTNVRTASHWADRVDGNYQCGISWQCPLFVSSDDKTGLYVFMQALGRFRYEADSQTGRPAVWEFAPGIHWRIADSCWMSLGLMRSSLLTCSWRY